MRFPLSSYQKYLRSLSRPATLEPAGPLPPDTVVARVPPKELRPTPRERLKDREVADKLDVGYYEPELG